MTYLDAILAFLPQYTFLKIELFVGERTIQKSDNLLNGLFGYVDRDHTGGTGALNRAPQID